MFTGVDGDKLVPTWWRDVKSEQSWTFDLTMTCGVVLGFSMSFLCVCPETGYGPPVKMAHKVREIREGFSARKSQKAGKLPPVPRQWMQIMFHAWFHSDFTIFYPMFYHELLGIIGISMDTVSWILQISQKGIASLAQLALDLIQQRPFRGRFWSTAVHGQSFNMVINMDIVRSLKPLTIWPSMFW